MEGYSVDVVLGFVGFGPATIMGDLPEREGFELFLKEGYGRKRSYHPTVSQSCHPKTRLTAHTR